MPTLYSYYKKNDEIFLCKIYKHNDPAKAKKSAMRRSKKYPFDVIIYEDEIPFSYILDGKWHDLDEKGNVNEDHFKYIPFFTVVLDNQLYQVCGSAELYLLKQIRKYSTVNKISHKGRAITLNPFWKLVYNNPDDRVLSGEIMNLYSQGMVILQTMNEDDSRYVLIEALVQGLKFTLEEMLELLAEGRVHTLDPEKFTIYYNNMMVGAN